MTKRTGTHTDTHTHGQKVVALAAQCRRTHQLRCCRVTPPQKARDLGAAKTAQPEQSTGTRQRFSYCVRLHYCPINGEKGAVFWHDDALPGDGVKADGDLYGLRRCCRNRWQYGDGRVTAAVVASSRVWAGVNFGGHPPVRCWVLPDQKWMHKQAGRQVYYLHDIWKQKPYRGLMGIL